MAPYSGPLNRAPNKMGEQAAIANVIDLSSGEEVGPGPHGPTASQDARALAAAPRRTQMPTVEIVEQPTEEFRFRYPLEGRTNGSIPGINNTPEHKTYPAIRINGYTGPAQICVSCVTKDSPYRPHPHKLVGKENCNGGVYSIAAQITRENSVVLLRNIGIQCVKRGEVAESLRERQQLHLPYIWDPFRTGVDYEPRRYASLGMHHVRLAVVVLLPDASGRCRLPLRPLVSSAITGRLDRMAIMYCSHPSVSVRGGTEIVLLTHKLQNQQMKVRFVEPATGWHVEVSPVLVHKMTSLVVRTPPFYNLNTPHHIPMSIQLCRPPTGDPVLDRHMVGDPFSFMYTPDLDMPFYTVPKRPRIMEKHLHESLAPKICQPKNEPTTKFIEHGQEDRTSWQATPSTSSSSMADGISIFLQQSETDLLKILTPIGAEPRLHNTPATAEQSSQTPRHSFSNPIPINGVPHQRPCNTQTGILSQSPETQNNPNRGSSFRKRQNSELVPSPEVKVKWVEFDSIQSPNYSMSPMTIDGFDSLCNHWGHGSELAQPSLEPSPGMSYGAHVGSIPEEACLSLQAIPQALEYQEMAEQSSAEGAGAASNMARPAFLDQDVEEITIALRELTSSENLRIAKSILDEIVSTSPS